MKIQEFANMLNGREYMHEITRDEEKQAKELGFVVVYGYSDDNMEFAGAISEEIGCYEGTTVYLNTKEIMHNECDNECCPYYAQLIEQCKTIESVWDSEGYSWIYKTDIPHATFDILEEGEKYCRGIVFSVDSLK